jgi:hypothetical protein
MFLTVPGITFPVCVERLYLELVKNMVIYSWWGKVIPGTVENM